MSVMASRVTVGSGCGVSSLFDPPTPVLEAMVYIAMYLYVCVCIYIYRERERV